MLLANRYPVRLDAFKKDLSIVTEKFPHPGHLIGKTIVASKEEGLILDRIWGMMWPAIIAYHIAQEYKKKGFGRVNFSGEITINNREDEIVTFRRA